MVVGCARSRRLRLFRVLVAAGAPYSTSRSRQRLNLNLQRRILATSSQRCQVFSKAPHPQTLFALVRGGGIPILHQQLRQQLQVPSPAHKIKLEA